MNENTRPTTGAVDDARPRASAGQLGLYRFSATQLLGSLVLLVLVTPFVEELPGGDLVEAVLFATVLLSAVLAVGAGRGRLAFAAVVSAPAFVAKVISHWRPDLVPAGLVPGVTIIVMGYVVFHLLNYVLHTAPVGREVLCAGISGYVMLGVMWAVAFIFLSQVSPGSISLPGPAGSGKLPGSTAIYFSFITLNTVGYGDIVPVSRAARVLTIAESTAGLFYVAVLISRLVSVFPGCVWKCEE